MPSIEYETIYKRSLSMIDDIDLASYTEDDFYDNLAEWLHTASGNPSLRKKFSSFSLDDEIMTLTFELANGVDTYFDTEFATTVLAKGLVICYFPHKLENTKNLAVMIGGKEEKRLIDNYSKNMERLNELKREYERDLSRHSYYFNGYGGTNG